MTIEQIVDRALSPSERDRRITKVAAQMKAEAPERWRAIARDVFGLTSESGARLLLPQSIAIQVASVNRKIGSRWCIDDEGRYLIAET